MRTNTHTTWHFNGKGKKQDIKHLCNQMNLNSSDVFIYLLFLVNVEIIKRGLFIK